MVKLKLENLKKPPVFKVAKPKEPEKPMVEPQNQHGGAREGSGRKLNPENEALRELRKMIKQHVSETMTVKVKQKGATGEDIEVEVKMPRLLAMLNQLFATGMRGNVKAIALYLDRTLGRQALPIKNEDDDDEDEQSAFRFVTTVLELPKPNGKQ